MAFKTTEWEYSNEVDQTQIPVEEGRAYLFIRDARKTDDGQYIISVENLNTGAQFDLRYFLETRDENNHVVLDGKTKGQLISLGIALAGVPIGIPNPVDIVGGVVSAYIYLKMSAKGVQYPRVYHFDPVNEDMAAFATIDQYYTAEAPASE